MATDILLPDGTAIARAQQFLYSPSDAASQMQRSNADLGVLINAVGATTTQISADQTNWNHRGVKVFVNTTNIGTGSITVAIEVKDPSSGTYYSMLQSGALTVNGNWHFTVYPGIPVVAAAPNVQSSANDLITRIFRIRVIANNANPATYNIGGSLVL